jgi:hypothetical protein
VTRFVKNFSAPPMARLFMAIRMRMGHAACR